MSDVSVLVLRREEVESLLEPAALLDALAAAFVEVSRDAVSMPARVAATGRAEDGWLAGMLAYVPSAGVIASKLVTLFPGNADRGLHTHHALVACFDADTGVPVALMDGASITARRTAGASALSVRLLARRDASTLAILGTGVQAEAHARAVMAVRTFRDVRIWGRDERKAEALADVLRAPARPVGDLPAAFRDADVVCATTHAAEPVVRREWLEPGMHVTSVGYNRTGREVDARSLRDARVFVESRVAALAPYPAGSNDLLLALGEGVVPQDKAFVELGEVLDGRVPGRESDDEITLYKSVGIAAEDAASAGLVLRAARERGLGTTLEL